MSKFRKLLGILMVSVFSLSLLFSTGCTRHPNADQIKALEEARSACLSSEQKLSEKQKEREALEGKLAQKKTELDNVKKEKEHVQQGLNNWSTGQ